jgi:hypothetical protein
MAAGPATPCGARCTLGDIAAEWIHVAGPFTIAGVAMFGAWTLDFALAFLIGIAVQYFTIVPMRRLSPGEGLLQAAKADALSYGLAGRDVRIYGSYAFRCIPRRNPQDRPGFLVPHADRHGRRLLDRVPGELVAAKGGREREDVA